MPCRLAIGATEVSRCTTLTTFGTPRGVTLDELAFELFPDDDASEQLLRGTG